MNFAQLKEGIRLSPLWPPILALRAARFERAYRRRRDRYRAILAARGLQYSETATIQEIRQRLAARGYRPRPRSLGAIRTFSVIGETSWHPSLLKSLRQLGPVHNCDAVPMGLYSPLSSSARAAARDRFNDHLLHTLAAEHARQPFDWVFVYGGGAVVHPRTIQRIHEQFGLPTAIMSLDDKNCWSTGPVGDVDGGQVDVASAYDLSWTSASLTVDWYLAQGGRPIFLPSGCDPDEYSPTTDHYDTPISFMGASYGARPVVVRFMTSHGIPIQVFGSGWGSRGRFAPSPADLFSRSQINFGIGGIAFSQDITNVKGRDFDVPCTGGGAYLTSFNPDLARFFDVGREILCYRNLDEAVELADNYLKNPDDCRAMAHRARQRCLREHTWLQRFLTILNALGVTADRPPAPAPRDGQP